MLDQYTVWSYTCIMIHGIVKYNSFNANLTGGVDFIC